MEQTFQVTDDDLIIRAQLYELYYEIPMEVALQILKRLTVVEAIPHEYLENTYIEFEPNFEEALRFFTPRVAIGLFNSADLNFISEILKTLRIIADNSARPMVGIEQMCRWEVEKYMLPD